MTLKQYSIYRKVKKSNLDDEDVLLESLKISQCHRYRRERNIDTFEV